jgi:hypothetical protein
VTATYTPGDIVKVTRTIKVDSFDGDYLHGRDVTDDRQRVFALDIGSTRVEMVKKSVQKSDRRPSVGASVSGRDISRIWWKRGTVILCTRTIPENALVLHDDGLWHGVTGNYACQFDDLNPDAKFVIKYLP